ISFRLANIIGPRNLSGPIPTFYKRLSEKKPCFVTDTRRDFVFVRDLVDVVVRAVDGSGETGIYHISSGGDFAIEDVYNAVVKAMNIRPEYEVEVRPRNKDDAFTILLDPSKTERDFDWKTETPLETTIQAAVDWYKRYGVDHTYTHLTTVKEGKSNQ
ncbi:NAD-dependent epimerase/dehydratase family protein, partial [Candidatus Latescibacterota bacterium]